MRRSSSLVDFEQIREILLSSFSKVIYVVPTSHARPSSPATSPTKQFSLNGLAGRRAHVQLIPVSCGYSNYRRPEWRIAAPCFTIKDSNSPVCGRSQCSAHKAVIVQRFLFFRSLELR